MESTVFQKIINRELPAHIVYEDDYTLAFLDIHPNAPGHTLVIPKQPSVNVFDTPEDSWLAVMRTVRNIAPAVRDAVGASGIHINSNHGAEAGQEVFHLHVHIIPRKSRADYSFWEPQEYAEGQADKIARAIKEKIQLHKLPSQSINTW